MSNFNFRLDKKGLYTRLVCAFMVFALVFGVINIPAGTVVSADTSGTDSESQSTVITFFIGEQKYYINGKSVQMDAAPFIKDDRTLVPVKYLAEAVGASVTWNESDKTVTLQNDSTTVVLKIGMQSIYINNILQKMDVEPIIVEGRTYLPAKYVSEAFGYEVGWSKGVVSVTKINATQPEEDDEKEEDEDENTVYELKYAEKYKKFIDRDVYKVDESMKLYNFWLKFALNLLKINK